MKYNSVAVLIPCYNEETTIGKVVSDFKKILPEAKIYVYDNNSTDKTVEKAKKAGAIIKYERRQGKGNVVRSMFRDIEADVYIMADGDDTYPADQAPKLAEAVIENGADMVIGDRLSSTYFTENKRFGHNFGNVLVRKLINRAFKSNVKDIMTGYRAFSYRFVKTFPVLSDGFQIETEMTIHALDKKMSLMNIPVEYKDRTEGSSSKLNTYSDGVKVLMTIFNMIREYRPLQFFSVIAGILLLTGGTLMTPILIEFSRTNLVPRFPTLFVAIMCLILAFSSFSTGLILDLIAKKHRQLFEINLNLVCKKK